MDKVKEHNYNCLTEVCQLLEEEDHNMVSKQNSEIQGGFLKYQEESNDRPPDRSN